MIIFNKNKLLSSETDCIGVVGDNIAYTQEFYIKGISDDSINYTLHLRFPDGSVNSVIPDITSVDRESTMLRWIVKKNDIFMHGYFEVQIEGVNSTGLVFQTEIVKLYADESIPIEDREFENPNSETLKLREEAYEMVQKLDEASDLLDGTDLSSIENTGNKVTSFESNFTDADNKKYPTIIALINYLKDYYYDIPDIDSMMESMQVDENGNLSITLPSWNGEQGETLVIGKVSGKDGVDGVNGKDGVGIASTTVETSALDGGTNAITFNLTNGKATTFTAKNGSKGNQGEKGVDGYTPIKGTDYWTDTDKDEIIGEVNETITQQLADLTQVEPNFANSIDECVDTSKVYVFPDGYIYAYMEATGALFTDQLKNAVDIDGTNYNNGLGYKADTYFNSSNAESASSGWVSSGYIPYNNETVIRMCGAVNSPDVKAGKIGFFDSSFTLLGTTNMSSLYSDGSLTYDETIWDGVYSHTLNLDVAKNSNSTVYGQSQNAKYFRFSIPDANKSHLCCTFDEEIEYGTTKTWSNTGHAFVPTDYEDRILELEEKTVEYSEAKTDHEYRLAELENQKESGIPTYVADEAESVIDKVIAAQGTNSFTFVAITDLHYGNSSNTEGVKHACKALQYIDSRIKLDAVAVLGDYTDGYPSTDYANAIADFKAVNAVINDLRFAPNLRLQGNHDFYADNQHKIHRFIQGYSDNVVWGDRTGGYFYRDFEEFKLRIICVNTTEENNDLLRCSNTQYNWFINSLDLSAKDDSSDWQILILSHHPLDWYVESEYVFCYILDAYKKGASWTNSDGTISCDFSGKNTAKLIGNIHAHIHNLLTDYIHFGNVNGNNKSEVIRIATPEACVGRENQYENQWAETTSYPKTTGTADETSFCVYCINLDTNKINAICYGAGYDREVEY